MKILEESGKLVVESPSKVNLFLEVLGKREDGYHELSTIMQAIDLCDELRIEAAPDGVMDFQCDHPQVPVDASNLVVKAAQALNLTAGSNRGARMFLAKRGPVGGGLGAGSANCAAALLGLNRLWNLGLSKTELHKVAASLGSDISFFLEGGTALCTGRGEKVKSVPCSGIFHYVLLLPGFPVPTAKVFQAMPNFLNPQTKDASIALEALRRNDFALVSQSLFNRLESPVFRLYPQLKEIKRQLASAVTGGVLLSGSGSTLYCLCCNEEDAAETEARVRKLGIGSVRRAHSYPF